MMDGRFDQQFAQLFAAPRADEGKKGEGHLFWPLAVACLCGLILVASAAILA
jgi:hypothetical protein